MKNTKLVAMVAIVTIAILTGLVINIFLTLGLREVEVCEPPEYPASPLPCGAVPTQFVMEHTECADHLLRAMNITNVRIQRYNGTIPGQEVYDDPALAALRAARERVTRANKSSTG